MERFLQDTDQINYKNIFMNIKTLLNSGANVTLSVTPADLREFFLAIAQEIRDNAPTVKEEPQQKAYLSNDEVAAKFGVCKKTLSRWNRDGYLKLFKIGGRIYYRRSDVEALLQQGGDEKGRHGEVTAKDDEKGGRV